MFGRNRKMIRKLTAILILSGILLCASFASGESFGYENKALLLPITGHETISYYVYDEAGNRIGRLPGSGWGIRAKLIGKDTVMLTDDPMPKFIHAGNLKVIAETGPGQIARKISSKVYLILDKQRRDVTFYNENAEIIGDISLPGEISDSLENYLYADVYETGKDYFIRIQISDSEFYVWVKPEEKTAYIETNPELLKWVQDDNMSMYAFGEFFAFIPYSGSSIKYGAVVTREGLVLMDDLEGTISPIRPEQEYDAVFYDEMINLYNSVSAVYRTGTSGYDVFVPEKLQLVGEVNGEYLKNRSAGGYFSGIAYPELAGNICEGFVLDVDKHDYIPYACKDDAFLILKDGELITIQGHGKPLGISSAYCVFEFNEGTDVYKVRDGSIFARYNEYPTQCVSLGSSGIAMNDKVEEGKYYWQAGRTIYDNDGNPVYNNENQYISAFVNGTWYARRGVYSGIMDLYGNWIVRDVLAKE
ncbi:MAG: hypothetical protein IJ123_00195 [Blautia sp.]|nr:hypothetical protein [Blautia sp.]